MKELSAELVGIDTVFQDPKNARTHSQKQLESIAASLERFGLQKPIVVDKNNIIIAGNGTHLAARDVLGWKEISVVKSGLSAEEARAYGIADNQLATHSEWNFDSLAEHIKDLSEWNPTQDWTALGFDDSVIRPIIEADLADAENAAALADFLENKPEPDDDAPIMAKPIKVTEEQWDVISQAINIIKLQVGDYKISAGRALELLAAEFLSGAPISSSEEE